MQYKVALELEGIHHMPGRREDTATKILPQSCWIQDIEQQTAAMTDLIAYKVSAWTCDPHAIPKVV
jgi:hypothetical protein